MLRVMVRSTLLSKHQHIVNSQETHALMQWLDVGH